LGLSITHVTEQPESWAGLLQTLRKTPSADVYNLRFYVSQEILRPFYASADGVLANSGHEPFGLLGLEAMAAGGLVFTGTTGEEYTLGGQCAIALDTDSPEEIVSHLLTIKADPGQDEAMRESARNRAADFTWEQVTKILLDKVQFVAQASGALPRPNGRDRLVARAPVTIPGQSHPEFFVPPSEDRNFQPTPDIG
jgi:glycosyltransferase involved in cell wall biosynthesis